jgi:hypothetical protein
MIVETAQVKDVPMGLAALNTKQRAVHSHLAKEIMQNGLR